MYQPAVIPKQTRETIKKVIYGIFGLLTVMVLWLTVAVAFDLGGISVGVASLFLPIISQLLLAGVLLWNVGWTTFHSFLVFYAAALAIGVGIAKRLDEMGRRARQRRYPRA